MNTAKLNRVVPRWGSILVALPVLVVILSGFCLFALPHLVRGKRRKAVEVPAGGELADCS